MNNFSQVFEGQYINTKINKFIDENSGKRVYFYGAGKFAETFLESYDLSSLEVAGFFDKDPKKRGLTIRGYKIFSLEDIENLNPEVIAVSMLNQYDIGTNLRFLGEYLKLDFKVEDDLFSELEVTGERQVAKTLEDIDSRHKQRYNFAAFFIDCYEKFYNKRSKIADIGCSIGYGSYIMASTIENKKLKNIDAFDIDEAAIDYAKKYYSHPKISHFKQDCLMENILGSDVFSSADYDAITCFELLEHLELEQSKKLINLLLQKSDVLISSFPIDNDSKFHKIKFSKKEIENYYNQAILNCPVKKRISHIFVQNDRYYVCVIENCL